MGAKFSRNYLDRPYKSEHSFGETYGEHKEHLEFSIDQMIQLKSYADELNISFGISPMDPISMQEVIEMQPAFIKIGSGDANNFHPEFLEAAAKSGLPIILSTGMQTQSTIESAVGILSKHTRNFAILHCISSYPTKVQDVNLSQMMYLTNRFSYPIGYSGHEVGYLPSLVATFFNAKIVERHFTFDKTLKGSDHKCSLDLTDLKEFVGHVRRKEAPPSQMRESEVWNMERIISKLKEIFGEKTERRFIDDMMGVPRNVDSIYLCEQPCHSKLGKSVVYENHMESDMTIEIKHLSVKVCLKDDGQKGIFPEEIYSICGGVLRVPVEKDQIVKLEHFE